MLAFVSIPFNGAAMTDRNGGSPLSADNSQECELIKAIIAENHLTPTGLYAVRNYNPGGKISDHRMMNAALERHFAPSQLDEAFKRIFHDAPTRTPRFVCDSLAAFVTETEAAKIVSRNRYDPDDYRHDLYRLKHGKERYTVYYFSSPVYFGDYAAMKYTARDATDARYRLYLLKKTNGTWRFLDILDMGVDESFQTRRTNRTVGAAKPREIPASGHAHIGNATGFRSRSLISQGGFRLQSCVQTEGVGS
ncbi:MAG TPA: hypothetical protein VJ806_14245 [Luteimonas sp.]|nr:hypothetical protein [Luteimonas sp.]